MTSEAHERQRIHAYRGAAGSNWSSRQLADQAVKRKQSFPLPRGRQPRRSRDGRSDADVVTAARRFLSYVDARRTGNLDVNRRLSGGIETFQSGGRIGGSLDRNGRETKVPREVKQCGINSYEQGTPGHRGQRVVQSSAITVVVPGDSRERTGATRAQLCRAGSIGSRPHKSTSITPFSRGCRNAFH